MSGKIELEYPYNEKWRKGYLVVNPENRKTLILYNSHKDRTSTQYARYLLSVSLKRFLTEDETVDHIDGDVTNNCLSNLQILSKGENIRKTHLKPLIELVCPVCDSVFHRTHSQLRGRKHKVQTNDICCSRSCGGKKASLRNNG